jgi:protein disulfide-isomerase A6
VKLAAVNCDEEANKSFCGSMGIQGFPTLKVVKPGKNGKPIVEDYQGPREAKAIVDYMTGKIPNHVMRITDKDADAFLSDKNSTAKAILFTEKGTISPLYKAVAIDFLGSITFGQVRNKETATVEKFGVTKFPTLILLPGGDAPGIVYNGEIKKEAMVAFISQVAAPNPDPAPAAAKPAKPSKKKDDKKSKAAKESFESASASHQASEASSGAARATAETLVEDSQPTESPLPVTDDTPKPVVIPEAAPPIPMLSTPLELVKECFLPDSRTCVLAFVPSGDSSVKAQALTSLAEVHWKHIHAQRHIFPFFAVPADSAREAVELRQIMGQTGTVHLTAVNRKRGWFSVFEGGDFRLETVEDWIDRIRMGEMKKEALPDFLPGSGKDGVKEVPLEEKREGVMKEAAHTEAEAAEPLPEATPAATLEDAEHDEL